MGLSVRRACLVGPLDCTSGALPAAARNRFRLVQLYIGPPIVSGGSCRINKIGALLPEPGCKAGIVV